MNWAELERYFAQSEETDHPERIESELDLLEALGLLDDEVVQALKGARR